MNSDRFYFRRFFKKPAAKTPARKRLMETMEDRILFDAAPVVTIEAPDEIGVGQTAEVTVSFSNGSADVGYGPWVDVFIDATGADGVADPLDPADPQTGNLDGEGPLLTPGDQFDGFTLTGNPTYLTPSNGLNYTLLTLDSEANGGLGVLHPYATDQLGNEIYIDINGSGQIVYHNAATGIDTVIAGTNYQTGDKLLVIELPFGSYTQAQPPADITFELGLSEFADVGQPLTLTAVGGFRYGNTPANDPATDPSIIGAGDAVVSDVGVTLATLNKTYGGPENETATGASYVRTYRINVDIATGQTLTDLHLFDDLDPTIQFVGISGSSHAYTVLGSLPSTTVPGGELAVRFDDPITGGSGGNDAWIEIQFYIPRVYDSDTSGTIDGADAAVLEPDSGADRLISNQAYGFGNWVPADPRDLGSAAIVGFNVDGTFDNTDLASALASAAPDGPAEHVNLEASPLVVKKDYTVVTNVGVSGNSPGDVLEFTLNFQISDYFAFDDLVISDLLSDGLRFDSSFVPTLEINGNTYVLGASGWTLANYTVSQNFTGASASGNQTVDPALNDGTTTLTFRISDELSARADSIVGGNASDVAFASDGKLLGGGVNPDDPSETIANSGYTGGATTGRIVYRAIIQDQFTDDFPSGEASLNARDVLTNEAVITGTVLDLTTGVVLAPHAVPAVSTDDSAESLTIASTRVTKTIYAVNGNTDLSVFQDANGRVNLQPGDVVTYRFQYTIPTGDIENLRFTDFLPLPIFDVDNINADGTAGGLAEWSFIDNTGNLAVVSFAPGTITYGPGHTLDEVTNPANSVPVITINSGGNSITMQWDDFVNTLNDTKQVDILLSATVSSDPFADGLYLTNMVQSGEGNTQTPATESLANAIIQIVLNQPAVDIYKGVVASTQGGAAPATGGLTFSGAGTGGGFTGTLDSVADAEAIGELDLDASTDVDAGDLVRFAIVAQNTGRSDAFDVTVTDTLTDSYVNTYADTSAFVAGTNFAVYRGGDGSTALNGGEVDAFVRAASTANYATLTGVSSTMDGITLANGDHVLLKNQNTASENGIYVVSAVNSTAGTMTLTLVVATPAAVAVTGGATNGNKRFTEAADVWTLDAANYDYFVAYDTAAKTFKVQLTDAYITGNTAGDVNDGGLSRGYNPATATSITNGSNAVVVLYDLTVASTAQASSTVTNTATLTHYAGADGADDHTAEDEIESASVVIAAPTATKTLVGTSVSETGNGQYQAVIGETATYTLTINIPEGTTGELTITDLLDSGLSFAELVSVTGSAGVTTDFSTFGDGAQTSTTDSNAQVYIQNDGRTVVFNLGDVVTNGTAGASAQTVTITYTAVVLNVTANQSGTVLDNTAEVAWEWTNDSAVPDLETEAVIENITDAANQITLVEPQISISNSLSLDNVTYTNNGTVQASAGQTVYYQVVISNTGTVAAYDLSLYDRLPNVFREAGVTTVFSVVLSDLDGSNAVTITADGNFNIIDDTTYTVNPGFVPLPALTSTGSLLDLAAGKKVTIVVEARVEEDAVAASTHPNGIQVRWTSLNDNVRSVDGTDTDIDPVNPVGGTHTPVVRSVYNADAVERTGAQGPAGSLNNYAATDDLTATILEVQPVAIAKLLLGTQIDNATNSDTQAVIGEYVDYSISFSIPKGLTKDFTLTDTLGSGLAFVELLSVTVGDDITTHVDGANAATADSLTAGDPDNLDLLNDEHITVAVGGGSFVIDFGDIYNAEVAAAPGDYVAPQQITITYRVLVTNIAANQTGQTRNNTAEVEYTTANDITPQTITISDTADDDVTIIEPALSITTQVAKDTDGSPGSGTTPGTFAASTSTPLDAGDYVYYRIRITNPAAGSTTAYDLQILDAVPSFIDPLSLTVHSVALTNAAGAVGGTISVTDGGTNTLDTADFAFTGNTLGVTGTSNLDLGPDSTLEIVVRGTVASTVAPAQSATNNATVRWSSLDGTTVAATSAYTTDDTERSGDGLTPAANTNAALPATNTGGTLNNYAATSANTTVTASTVTLTKTIVATSESHTTVVSGTERVAIGEIVRYRLVTTLPEGVSVDMLIRDNLPNGMLFVNDGTAMIALVADTASNISSSTFGTSASVAGDAATLASITPSYALDDASVSKATASDDDSWNTGNDPLFKLGTITNSENDADLEYIVIEFNALVLNTAATGNQSGTTLGNNYEVFLNNSTANGDKLGSTSSTVNVIVAEPNLTVSQNVSTTGPVDAGDTFTYTITIENNATGNNAAAAFDIRIRDILDALTASNPGVELELAVAPSGTAGGFVGGSVALTAPGYASVTANSSDTTQVDLTLNRLDAGDSITLVVTATVKSGALAGSEIENKAVVTYTSLPGSGTALGGSTIATALAGSTVTGGTLTTLTANTSERSGADSEGTVTDNTPPADSAVRNNYAVAAVATSGLTVATPALDLSWKDGTLTADDTSVGSSSGANAVIGETVTFDILVTLPEGVTDDLRVDVALPAGLRIDGYTVVTTAAGSARLTADFNGTVDATPTVTLPSTGPSTVTFDFGDTTTVNDNVANNNAFVLRVTATVVNALSNQAAVTRTTSASLRYNDPDGSGNAGPAADRTVTDSTPANDPVVTIVEPTLTVTKGSTLPAGSPLDAGDVIDYTITLSNSSGQTAYDVTLSDPIDSQLVVSAGIIPGTALTISGGATVSADAFEIVDLGGGNFTLRTAAGANIDIPDGESVVITFSATVSNSIPPAATISNTANARWTSTDGTNADERGGGDVADTAPTTINQALTTGALNNYALSSGVVNDAVNDITITKAVIDTSIGNDTVNATPGELVTYRLTITLPEGTVPDLRIRDAIPAGMAYVPGSIVLNTTGFVGSVTAPAVSPTSGTTYTDGQDIEFDFSSIMVTADNNAANNTFTFTYQAVVLDVASNVGLVTGQDTLTNTATHNNGTGSTFSESAGSDSITVVEPQLSITKTRNTATADAGDAVTYTITIAHTGQSTSAAYDLDLADTLPAGFTASGFTATIATANDSAALFDLTGQAFTTTGTVNLALGQTLTVVITGAFNGNVTPNQTVNNAATLTYDSHPGDITDRGNTDVTTDRDRETSINDDVDIDVPEATFTKTLFSTGDASTTGTNVAIGETVTYALLVTLPEGTTPDLSILDRLPPGMQYVSSSIVTDAASSGGLLTADFNGTLPAPSVTGGATSGADVGFTFGSISVTGDNVAGNNSFVILVTARVENVTGNQSGTTLSADATFDISGDGVAVFTTSDIDVTVVEPRVTVTQTVTSSTAGLDAGDTVTYQVTINNLSANGATADAFDVTLSDVLPAGMLIGTIGAPTLTGGATVQTALSGATTNTLAGTFDIPLGGQVVFTFTAVIPDTVTPGQSLTADINVEYSSLNGNPADARDGTDVADPESNTLTGDLDNYAVGADTTVTAIAPFAVTKTLTNTSLGADTSALVVIGEVLTYTVTVTVMEGTTENIVLNDTLPAGLEFIAGSAVLTANGMTITGFDTDSLDQTLTSVINPGNTDAPGTANTDTFTYTYQVRVTDIPANVAGQTRTNDLDASADDVTSDNNNQVTVTITEPSLTLDKVTTTTGSDAGDEVVYTLTITNASGANVGTAYDINVTDLLDANIQLINTTLGSGIVVTGATVDANTSTTGSLNLILQSLAPGDSITITLNAVVKATAPAGATIENAASITYSTLPDGHADEASERSDYEDDDTSASFTLDTPTIDKQTPADTTYSIGEIVTYDIVITLPEGVTEDLVITDNLPAGLVYTGYEVVSTGFAGLVTATPTVGNPSGNVRTFTFGDVTTTGDNNGANNAFTLRVSARVANIVDNQGEDSPTTATTFSNTATLQYTDGTDGTTTVTDTSVPGAITVVEPVLEISSEVTTSTANVDAGDTVTYQITVRHTGDSTAGAFDLDLTSLLPDELDNYTLVSADLDGNDVSAGFDITGVNFTTTGDIDLALGEELVITISGKAKNSNVPGTVISQDATVTYTSVNGANANERDGSGGTNDYTATDAAQNITTVGVLDVAKVADKATATIGEVVTYTVTVTVAEGTTTVNLADILPDGLVFIADSAELTTPGGWTITGFDEDAVNQTLTVTNPGTTDGAATLDSATFTYTYQVRVENIIENQDAETRTNGITATADLNADTDTADAGESQSDDDTVTVVEPVLTFSKDAVTATTGLDAGDTIQFTLTFENTGTATAHDVNLLDSLPAGLLVTSIDSTDLTGGATADTAATGVGTASLSGQYTVPVGGKVVVTYTVTLQNTVNPDADYDSTATLNWSSLNGPSTHERDGDDGIQGDVGVLNDYSLEDTVTASTATTFQIVKTADKTTAAIGETITYTLTLTLNEGTTRGVVLTDTLPVNAGVLQLGYVTGSAAIVHTTAGGSITGSVTPVVSGAQNQTLTFTLGDIVVPAGASANTVTITYEVVVANVANNQAGDTEANSVTGTSTDIPPGTDDTTDNTHEVTLTEPSLTLDKVTTTTGSDAGDEVIYTLTITNASGANVGTAYDINVIDLLDANIELIDTTLGSGIVVTGATVDTNTSTTGSLNLILQSLAPGDSVTITLNAVVKATAPAGATIENAASITYTSTPGTNPDERGGTGGVNDYEDDDTSASFTLDTPTIDKQTPADTTYSIGEIVTYDIVITLPEGVTEDLVITDNLPAGLVYTGYEVVSTGFAGTVTATPTVGNPSGNVRTFTFGDVTTTGDNNGANNTFTLRVSARIANIVGNQGEDSPTTATTFSNTATLQYTDGTDGTTTVTDASAPGAITVVEPVLQITKTVVTDDDNLDAGDTVTYEIVVSHTAASTADAFDLLLADTLPAQLTGFTLDSALIGAANVAGSFTLTAGGVLSTTAGAIDLAQGETLTLRISGVIRNTVVPGTDINNTVSLTYTSVDGVNANERDGSGGTNDYTATADAPELTTVGTLAVTKTADVTTAAIGDTVTYTVTVTVAQGTTTVSLADTLPAGLVFVANSAALTTPGGWTITGFNANTVNQTLTITNPGTTDDAAALESASFTYTYEVLVQNVVGNQAGDTRTNAIVATADLNDDGDTDDAGESDNDSDTITLTEPSLSLTKVTTTEGTDAGDEVVYTLTITNSNAANTSTAYDINIIDLLDTDIELISALVGAGEGIQVSGATVSANTSTTGSLNLILQSLAPGDSVTITLNAVVKATAPAGATVANTASITYTSTPGANTDERGGSGGVNDYADSDTSDSFVLATPTIDKLDSATTSVAVGGTFSYDIDITLTEGVTRDLVITDLLPAGLILVSTSIDDSNFVGTLPSPVITGGVTSGQDIVLNFGNVTTTDDNDTTNNTFRVTVTVRAVNELGNQDPATTFENTATLSYTNGTTLVTTTVNDPTAPDAVTLTEPVVTVDKTVTDDSTPHLGQTITYQIVLTNTGTSTAYDVVFSDLIPDDLTGVAITGEVLAGGATLNAPGSGAAFNGTNTGLGGTYDIPVGGTVTITYTAIVSTDPAVVGGTFNNADEDRNSSVTVTYSSLDGNPAEARDGADGSAGLNNYTATDDAPITIVGPGLRLDKTDGLASVTAGQSWTYTLTITNVGTDTATGVTLTDTIPPQITVNAVRVGGSAVAFSVVAGQVVLNLPDVLHTAGDNSLAVEFDVTLDAVIDAAREDLTNTASVTHDDVEPTPADNTASDTNVISATPGIGVIKTVGSVNGAPPTLNGSGQPVVAPGDTVIYTIVLTNTGTQNVVVDITDTFPRIVLDLANATIDDSDTGVAASVNLATGVITWNNVALDVGETITITIEAEAFDPQLQALDTFPNTVVVSDITDEVPDEEDTVVADLSAFPDLVVTKVNSTDRIGINDVFTYTITLTNAGDQNAENVTIVDTLPPYVEFISASGNYIYDPVARTVTWNSADNPQLAVVDGRNAETVRFTLTVTLPLNTIVFGDLTNTVRAFDDGTNGPDLNPEDNEDTQTTDVLGFLYDRLRNFSDPHGDEDDNPYELGLPIKVYRDAILPIAPIYSGAAEPGSTLEVALYNADGEVIGRQTVVVDTGGNWMASFPGTIMKDYPQSVVITQTPAAASSDGASHGYNLRPYYATAINAGHFFRENLNVARVSEQTPTRVTDDLQEALSNPIGFAVDAASYESLASPGHPTGR